VPLSIKTMRNNHSSPHNGPIKTFSPKSYYLCVSNNEKVQNSKTMPKKFKFLCTFKGTLLSFFCGNFQISGLAASRHQTGIFWGHTDSGGSPAAYAIRSESGKCFVDFVAFLSLDIMTAFSHFSERAQFQIICF
jgi:hypothetical protein